MTYTLKPMKGGGRWKYRGCIIVIDINDDCISYYCIQRTNRAMQRRWKLPFPEFSRLGLATVWIDKILDPEPPSSTPPGDPPTPASPTPTAAPATQSPSDSAVGSVECIKVSGFSKDSLVMQKIHNKGPEKPDSAATVRTYDRFEETLNAFASKVEDPKGFKFLLIIGKGGKGKTECVKAAIERCGYAENNTEGGYGYRRGKLTGFELYKFLYQFRNYPVVLDDINDMMRDRTAPSIIQAATETRLPRSVQYSSSHADIGYDEDQTPPIFKTSSPVIIIANEWNSTNHVIKSIETRAYTLYFNPSNEEVHNVYVPKWFGTTPDEQTVYRFIGDWLDYVPNLHCRTYTLGRQLHYNRPDVWQEELTSALIPDAQFSECLALKLLNDTSLASDKERIEKFAKCGGGSVATFKRIKAGLGLSRQNRPTDGDDGRRTRWGN